MKEAVVLGSIILTALTLSPSAEARGFGGGGFRGGGFGGFHGGGFHGAGFAGIPHPSVCIGPASAPIRGLTATRGGAATASAAFQGVTMPGTVIRFGVMAGAAAKAWPDLVLGLA